MHEECFETIEANGRVARIYQDADPMPPNEWRSGDAGEPTIYYTSRRYTLGHEQADADTLEEMTADPTVYWMPVYAYIHGGATISLGAFGCPWDSGQSGIIAVRKADFARMIGHRRWNGATARRARADFAAIVAEFANYLEGDVWGYVIDADDASDGDSCWGFYGLDTARSEALASLKAMRPPAPPIGDVLEVMAQHVA